MHMHNIEVDQNDFGDIILKQVDNGETDQIYLHPEQLRFIARRVAGLKESTAEQVLDLERKLRVLVAGLASFVCDNSVRSEILDRCPSGPEFIERLDGLLNLAWEMDGGRLSPEDMERDSAQRTHATPSLSVTNQEQHSLPL